VGGAGTGVGAQAHEQHFHDMNHSPVQQEHTFLLPLAGACTGMATRQRAITPTWAGLSLCSSKALTRDEVPARSAFCRKPTAERREGAGAGGLGGEGPRSSVKLLGKLPPPHIAHIAHLTGRHPGVPLHYTISSSLPCRPTPSSCQCSPLALVTPTHPPTPTLPCAAQRGGVLTKSKGPR
jgi:hypothetical protein